MTTCRRRGRRGVAIADFLAGMLVLSGALTGFAAMTRAKMDALAQSDQLARGVAAAEEALDRLRVSGLPKAPSGFADVDGFRVVTTFAPTAPGLFRAEGRVDARALRASEGAAVHGLFEVRVVVSWQDSATGRAEVRLSTVAPLPEEGGR